MSLIHAPPPCCCPWFCAFWWTRVEGITSGILQKRIKFYKLHIHTSFSYVPNKSINPIYVKKHIMTTFYFYFYLSKHVNSFNSWISELRFGCLMGVGASITSLHRPWTTWWWLFITPSISSRILWWHCAGIAAVNSAAHMKKKKKKKPDKCAAASGACPLQCAPLRWPSARSFGVQDKWSFFRGESCFIPSAFRVWVILGSSWASSWRNLLML